MTDPTPPEGDPPVEIAWDPEGDQLAAVEPDTVTVTADDDPSLARGGQHTS